MLEILRNGGGSLTEDSIKPKMIKTSCAKNTDSITTTNKTRINQVKQIMSQINEELTSVVTKKTAEGDSCRNAAGSGANKRNNTSKTAPNLIAQVIILFDV